MKGAVKFLSIIAIIVSIIWLFKSGFDYEPMVVLLGGIIGFITQFYWSNTNKRDDPKASQSFKGGNQEVNVNVNIDKPENKEVNKTMVISEPNITRDEIIELMKPKIKILFVDDDTQFNVVKILKDSGWK
ncbi:MAG TPA: hypothetical protein PKC76_19070 [Saprospiraceae bacterium]|nr:hypothetical protein [Saprospiraceae bacterium]HMP26239.1 hypothetical protein [Saprospiraceae bacterium]